MSGVGRVAVAAMAAAVLALASAGAASADNSNSNTNNNDVTQLGSMDASDSSGASEKTNWPPTDLGWPPQEVMAGGVGDSGGKKSNDNGGSASKPIVMPDGQSAAASEATPTTSETAKPIVPAGSP